MNLKNRDVSFLNNMNKIYADHAATTKLSEKALMAMMPYLQEDFKNPSTLYLSARVPRKAIADAREVIATAIGSLPNEIYFTSGGTEADNWAIKNVLFSGEQCRNKIITTCIEHHAILNSCKIMEKLGYEVVYLPVDREGIISSDALEKEMGSNVALVSIMHVNNEIGTMQNIKELAEIAHKCGALFHTDAVQAVGHIEIQVNQLGVDMLSASAHKFNGPKGVGFLYLKNGVGINSFITGGSQESGKRAGTENVAGIVGMSEALKENVSNLKENNGYLLYLEGLFVDLLKKNNIDFMVNGSINKKPGNISLSIADADGEVLLHRLDLKGIEVATSSACDSVNHQISHVIRAIGVPEKYARGTIRISLGADNTIEEIQTIAQELSGIVHSL